MRSDYTRQMIVINKNTSVANPELFLLCQHAVARDYHFLRGLYPEFGRWFAYKVLPGVLRGERTISIEERWGRVVGLLILKHTGEERKLCTLRVTEDLQNRGLGIRLFEYAFEILETEKPLLSVADVNKSAFERIFRYFNFESGGAYRGLYRPDSVEFAYNGQLLPALPPAGAPYTTTYRISDGPTNMPTSPLSHAPL